MCLLDVNFLSSRLINLQLPHKLFGFIHQTITLLFLAIGATGDFYDYDSLQDKVRRINANLVLKNATFFLFTPAHY